MKVANNVLIKKSYMYIKQSQIFKKKSQNRNKGQTIGRLKWELTGKKLEKKSYFRNTN